jgi:hypothetical protein
MYSNSGLLACSQRRQQHVLTIRMQASPVISAISMVRAGLFAATSQRWEVAVVAGSFNDSRAAGRNTSAVVPHCAQGAGVGSLLALRLNTEEAFQQQLGGVKVTCIAIATAACLSR